MTEEIDCAGSSPNLRMRPQEDTDQFNFGQFFVYCLEKGYGEDPDSIVKYEVMMEEDEC